MITLDRFQHDKWFVKVIITTEQNKFGVVFLHPEKKFFVDETNQSETMTDTIKIILKSDELSQQIHK